MIFLRKTVILRFVEIFVIYGILSYIYDFAINSYKSEISKIKYKLSLETARPFVNVDNFSTRDGHPDLRFMRKIRANPDEKLRNFPDFPGSSGNFAGGYSGFPSLFQLQNLSFLTNHATIGICQRYCSQISLLLALFKIHIF